MPRWLSSAKMEVVRSLLSEDPAMLLRESMGVSADSTQKAFPSESVQKFMNRRLQEIPVDIMDFHSRHNTNHIIVAVDPAGGGSSQFAIASLLQLPNGTVVMLGAESLRTKDVRETHKLIISHIAKLRQLPAMHEATIVLVLESNLAYEAQHILHALNTAGVKRWIALSEGAGGTIGWLTTNERKEAMCFQLRDHLNVGSITLFKTFVCLTMPEKEMFKILDDELRNFCILLEAPKTPFGKVKKTYSGKVGGRNDDIAIAFQLALAGCRCFYSNEKYGSFRLEL